MIEIVKATLCDISTIVDMKIKMSDELGISRLEEKHMYDYKLNENEEVVLISDNGLLKKDDKVVNVSTIITNQRFLILEIPEDLESFRVGRSINYPIKKEVILDIAISSIVEVLKENEYGRYVLDNTNYFYLNDDKVYDFMKEN